MKKMIQKRSQYVSWFEMVRRDAEAKLSRLMKSSHPDQDEMARLNATIENSNEEAHRYRLTLKVCGNSVTALV